MKTLFASLVLTCLITLSSFSNNELEPVKWVFSAKQIKTDEYMLIFEAKLAKNWHIYSQQLEGDGMPTTFYFLPSDKIEFTNSTMEEKGEAINHNALVFYKNRVLFTTNVRLKSTNAKLTGYVNYVPCNDERCLSPKDIPFEFVFGQ